MILQYKDFKNNWHMEEARQISWGKVNVEKETRDYRLDGERYKYKLVNSQSDESFVKEMHKAVDKLIRQEIGISNNIDIIYHINCPFSQMENVSVVVLKNNDFDVAYVFDKTVYILNSEGKTVQRV